MTRFIVYGYYTDEPQVVADVVDAVDRDAAEVAVKHARGGDNSDYTCDGVDPLDVTIRGLLALLNAPAKQIRLAHEALAGEYAHYHEDAEEMNR